MAKLPDYTSLGSPQSSAPVTGVASYTDPTGAANEQLGGTEQKAGSDFQDLVNVADVNNAYANSYAPQANALAQNYYSLQGKAAIDAAPQFQASMTKLGQDVAGTLQGQAATSFTKMMQVHQEQELYRASLHTASQTIAYNKQAASSMLENDMSNYSSQVLDDPTGAADTLNNAIVGYKSHLTQIGAPPEQIEEATRNIDAHAQVAKQAAIQQRLNALPGDTQKALLTPLMQAHEGTLPQDMGADLVKPYTAKQVTDIRNMVATKSPYDDLFQKYGQQYGVDPQELKLHAAAESSMNPKADNGQSQGLMQLSTGNIESMGIKDPFDPAQSIEGAAKLMAQNKQLGANDTRAADKMYYGGPSTSQQGPNTEQYAENLAAVRGQASAASGSAKVNNPDVPAWLAGADPSTLPKLAQMANASASREARLTQDQNETVVDSAKRDFFSKVAAGTATAKDAMDPNLPTDKIPEYLNMVAKGDKVDPNSPTVIKQRGVLEDMKVNDPVGFKALDLSTMGGKLPSADISKLQSDQMAMKTNDTSILAQNKQAKEVGDSINDMLPLNWQKPKNDKDEQSAAAFRGNLITSVKEAQASGGKPMSRDEIRGIASDMLKAVSIKGAGIFGTDETLDSAAQIPAGTDPLSVYRGTPDNIYVPESFRNGFTRAWVSKFNKPPQETDIRSAYLKDAKK